MKGRTEEEGPVRKVVAVELVSVDGGFPQLLVICTQFGCRSETGLSESCETRQAGIGMRWCRQGREDDTRWQRWLCG